MRAKTLRRVELELVSGNEPDMSRTRTVCVGVAAICFGLGCGSGDGMPTRGSLAAPVGHVDLEAPADETVGVEWADCGSGFDCGRVDVPLDYSAPQGPKLTLAVARLQARDPARRIGSLFFNFGGPGVATIDLLFEGAGQYFSGLNSRFDIVGFDPRGIGRTEGAIDCKVDPATDESEAFVTPENLDREAWVQSAERYVDTCMANNPEGFAAHVSTTDAARDMDLLRRAVGDEKLTFVGKSYGSLLGATYASLFPDNYRALVLDGGINPDEILNRPTDSNRLWSAAAERAFDRFLQACALDQVACFGFGGADPRSAFDALVAQANESPIPATGSHPRPIDGDDILSAAFGTLYEKRDWQPFAAALVEAEAGDATRLRVLVDEDSGLLEDGTYDPMRDRNFSIASAEQSYSPEIEPHIAAGELAWSRFPHFWWIGGYSELANGLFPVEAEAVFRGPFVATSEAPPILVLSTRFDPATSHEDALALVEQLGNAQLLIMNGDGHTAYGGRSSCIDAAVGTYLADATLPPSGRECPDGVSFARADTVPPRGVNGRATRARYDARAWRLPRALRGRRF